MSLAAKVPREQVLKPCQPSCDFDSRRTDMDQMPYKRGDVIVADERGIAMRPFIADLDPTMYCGKWCYGLNSYMRKATVADLLPSVKAVTDDAKLLLERLTKIQDCLAGLLKTD